MILLIFSKWLTDFSADASKAPSILNKLITVPLNSILGSGKVKIILSFILEKNK